MQDFYSTILGTFLGALLGIPAGLLINYPKFVSWEESWVFFEWESLMAGRHEGSAWTIGV